MVPMNNTDNDVQGVAEHPNPQQWVAARAACTILNVSTASLYRLVDAGLLHAYYPETGTAIYWRPELERLKSSEIFQERRKRA